MDEVNPKAYKRHNLHLSMSNHVYLSYIIPCLAIVSKATLSKIEFSSSALFELIEHLNFIKN